MTHVRREANAGIDRFAETGREVLSDRPCRESSTRPHGATEGEECYRCRDKKRLAGAQTVSFHPPLSR